jgi:molybdopterin molybdotransferase
MSRGLHRAQTLSARARLADVLTWIDGQVRSLPAEDIGVAHALGRVLARDVTTEVHLPAVDRAAVNGLAVRAHETVGASVYNPLSFRTVVGHDDLPRAAGVLVHAGDRLPRGADAVAPQDQLADAGDGGCSILEPVVAGTYVERIGSQAVRGGRLAQAGRKVRPADIGLLVAAGIGQVPVVRRPRARCLLAGRDVIEAGTPLPPGAVYDANGPLLASLITRDGGLVADERRVDRSIAAIGEAIVSSDADIILVAGGSGTGADDHASAALAEAGMVAAHGVALRPGDTVGMGLTTSGVLVFLLPGTPVACLWAYELLTGRAIRRLGRLDPSLPFPSRMMTTRRKIVSEVGMTEVCPVQRVDADTIAPMASFAEAGLGAATQADGFVILPEGSEGYAQGASVLVYLYDEASSRLAMEAVPKP